MTWQTNSVNTLAYDPGLCIGCGMCSTVCPHRVFAANGRVARLVLPELCIECGACQRNCPTQAITVESGAGCAAALIMAALTGREPSCGGPEGGCCGGDSSGVSCC